MLIQRKFLKFVKDPNHVHNSMICVAALISGLVAVLYAKLFRFCEYAFEFLISHYQNFIFIVTPVAFFLSWYFVFNFSKEASGSGIPQVLVATSLPYNGRNILFIHKLLSFRMIIIKMLSSFICALGGGAIGREGPTIQISAGIFHLLSRKIDSKVIKIEHNLWIVTGAGAGLAAAFNTPLGGIIYTIEEIGSHHFMKVKNILLISVIISGLVAQGILGNYLYFGSPNISKANYWIWFVAIFVGFISGFLGAIWSKIVVYFYLQINNIKNKKLVFLIPVFCGFIMAVLIYFNKQSAGSGVSLIMNLLYDEKNPSITTFFFRFFGTFISAASGVAGGIFSPSLAIGASIGHACSIFFANAGNHLLILIGMVGFLTGVARIPFTASILVFEMTNEHTFLFPMMSGALFALLGARIIGDESFYEMLKEVLNKNIVSN